MHDDYLITRIAWLYHMEGLTQQEIGEQVGVSRLTVNRLLQQALSDGIVQITINTPDDMFFEMERELCKRFDLKDAVVVMEAEHGKPLYLSLMQGTVRWLKPHLKTGTTIGLGLGRTMSYLPYVFESDGPVDCTFIETVGGSGDYALRYNISVKMAELTGGKAVHLYAPTVVSSPEARETYMNEPSIKNVLEQGRNCDIMLHAVGSAGRSAVLYQNGYLDDSDLEALRANGAIGDMLGWFFDQDGCVVPQPLEGRYMGLTLDDVRQMKRSIVVSGGDEKVEAIRAAIRGGLVKVLITDASTARQLLEMD